MKTILVLFLLGCSFSLYAQKHFEIKVTFEAGSPGVSPRFKVDVKNVTDSTLLIFNDSEYLVGHTFNPKNSYFVVDYVLNNGQSGIISGIPLTERNEHTIKVDAHQSIENKFRAIEVRGLNGFTGIFPSDFELSKVAKVRFRLVKFCYSIKGLMSYHGDTEYTSNWVTLKGR